MPSSGSEADANPTCRRRVDVSLVVSLVVYLVAAAGMWWAIFRRTGEISYTLDDAYIHCAISKNLATNGTFGFVPGVFAAGSSSLLWTVLLALTFLLTGPQIWVPGLLATLTGALCVERMNALLKTAGIRPIARIGVVLLAMVCGQVLPVLATGMEHLLHIWALLGLFNALLRIKAEPRKMAAIFLWAFLAAGARYESLFALPPLLLWLAWRGSWRQAFALGLGMAVPVLTFAIYSKSHGGFALPNSLMLKGNVNGATALRVFYQLSDFPWLQILAGLPLLAALVLWRTRGPVWLPLAVLGIILIHIQLAQIGWSPRYESYLIILAVISVALVLVPVRKWLQGENIALACLAYVALAGTTFQFIFRAIPEHGRVVREAGNIHDQQVQMARVVRLLGPGARVAVNDLGAVSFLSEGHVLDLWGLGDNITTHAKREGRFGADFLRQRLLDDHTDYVICYPSWFTVPDTLPTTLIPVESWKLGDNVICGSDTVVFYGTSPEAAKKLAAALDRYRSEFPADPRSTNQMNPIATK